MEGGIISNIDGNARSNARGSGDGCPPARGDTIGPAKTRDSALRRQGSISYAAATDIVLGPRQS